VDQTPVLIIGAGPVGLTLACDLGRRGIDCILIEKREAPLRLPKMERCNARSMEIYRRMGYADAIRAISFPPDKTMDIGVMESMAKEPLVRLEYPSVAECRDAAAECRDGSLPLEPYQIVSQYTLEPFLRDRADEMPNVDVRFSTELISFEQDDDGVTAQVETLDGTASTIRADYLVGCDGGRSTVRKSLGIELEGKGGIARRNQVFLKCDNFFDLCPSKQGRMYFFANEDQSIITVQDDLKHFSFHTECWGEDEEIAQLILDTIGLPIDFEILAKTGWTLHLLVAERFMEKRVLLAGDCVHLVIPSGGLGLNTGIGDAIDMAWKLEGAIRGWGGPNLVPSYEAERLPIGRRNRDASGYAAQGQMTWRNEIRPWINDDTPEGRGTREAVVRLASVEQRKTHEMVGTEQGYRYEDSPIVVSEPGPWPPDVREVYIPTSRPGARLPHMWLDDGRAIHDAMGDGYTLLRLDPDAPDTSGLVQAFESIGAPVDVLEFDQADLRDIYGADLLLCRPDLHITWRGDQLPDDVASLAARATGH
jgi:2-polyprenyl-6-methoxyphenol hydroxylase-like FAD-dependent oxidoreductase